MGAFQSITKNILPHRSRPGRSFELVRLAGSVFFILLVFSTGLVAQVKIQERVRISPQVARDSSAFLHQTVDGSRWGASHVLGIPLKRWLEMQQKHSKFRPVPKTSSITSPASVACGEVAAVINPTEIFYASEFDFQTFFTTSGTFEMPSEAGTGVLLRGGPVQGPGVPPFPVCCIGANDRLIIEINGIEVFNFDLTESGQLPIDPNNAGIDFTAHVHPGTNTYSAIALDDHGFGQWLPPLRFE